MELRDPIQRAVMFALVALLASCVDGDEAQITDFKHAIPSADQLVLTYPGVELGAEGEPLPKPNFKAVLGEESPAFRLAVTSMSFATHGLSLLLEPLRNMVDDIEPSVETPRRVVWLGAKGENMHRLVVLRHEVGHFEYVLTVRPKGAEAGPWRVLVAGTHVPEHEGRSSGSVWTDLDVDPNNATQGKTLVFYQNDAKGSEVTLHHYGFRAAQLKQPFTGSYRYTARTDGTGSFELSTNSINLHGPLDTLETLKLHVGWDAEGAGRSDSYGFGGDIVSAGLTQVHLIECWSPPDHAVTDANETRKKTGAPPFVFEEAGELTSCYRQNALSPVIPAAPPEPDDGPWLKKIEPVPQP